MILKIFLLSLDNKKDFASYEFRFMNWHDVASIEGDWNCLKETWPVLSNKNDIDPVLRRKKLTKSRLDLVDSSSGGDYLEPPKQQHQSQTHNLWNVAVRTEKSQRKIHQSLEKKSVEERNPTSAPKSRLKPKELFINIF